MKLHVVLFFLTTFCLLLAAPAVANDIRGTNGGTTGTADAWTVNFGFAVSDSFVVGSGVSADGAEFIFWLTPGDTSPTIDLSIGTSAFGSDVANFTNLASQASTYLGTNQYGFNLEQEAYSFRDVALNPGTTYWITSLNASSLLFDPVYWDENSGPPAVLAENTLWHRIPSESFTILGNSSTTCTGCGCWAHPDCGPPMPEPESILLLGSGGTVTLLGLGALRSGSPAGFLGASCS